jgi:hypothetical protein
MSEISSSWRVVFTGFKACFACRMVRPPSLIPEIRRDRLPQTASAELRVRLTFRSGSPALALPLLAVSWPLPTSFAIANDLRSPVRYRSLL